MLQQFIDAVGVGVSQLLALVLGLAPQISLIIATHMNSTALPRLANLMQPVARSRAGSAVRRSSDTSLPHSNHQSQIYSFVQASTGPSVKLL